MDQTTKAFIAGLTVIFVIFAVLLLELYRNKEIDVVEGLSLFAMLVAGLMMALALFSRFFFGSVYG